MMRRLLLRKRETQTLSTAQKKWSCTKRKIIVNLGNLQFWYRLPQQTLIYGVDLVYSIR